MSEGTHFFLAMAVSRENSLRLNRRVSSAEVLRLRA
jgi:hypothetical protein